MCVPFVRCSMLSGSLSTRDVCVCERMVHSMHHKTGVCCFSASSISPTGIFDWCHTLIHWLTLSLPKRDEAHIQKSISANSYGTAPCCSWQSLAHIFIHFHMERSKNNRRITAKNEQRKQKAVAAAATVRMRKMRSIETIVIGWIVCIFAYWDSTRSRASTLSGMWENTILAPNHLSCLLCQ